MFGASAGPRRLRSLATRAVRRCAPALLRSAKPSPSIGVTRVTSYWEIEEYRSGHSQEHEPTALAWKCMACESVHLSRRQDRPEQFLPEEPSCDRWTRHDPLKRMSQRIETAWSPAGAWLWLFPLAYGLHIAEEHWLRFPAWLAGLGRPFVSSSQFLFLNAVFWLLMVAAVLLIRRSFIQSMARRYTRCHSRNQCRAASSWQHRHRYLFSGLCHGRALYIPLVVYALRQVLPRVDRGLAVRAGILGVAIHGGVMLLAANLSVLSAL